MHRNLFGSYVYVGTLVTSRSMRVLDITVANWVAAENDLNRSSK